MSGRRGFTLVELLVALVIGSSLLLGVAAVSMKIGQHQHRSSAVAYQTVLLRRAVEEYGALSYDSLIARPASPAPVDVAWDGPGLMRLTTRITTITGRPGRRVLVIVSHPLTAPDTISVDRVPSPVTDFF